MNKIELETRVSQLETDVKQLRAMLKVQTQGDNEDQSADKPAETQRRKPGRPPNGQAK